MLWFWAVIDEKGSVEEEGFLSREAAERCARDLNDEKDGHTYKVDLLPM